MSRSFHSWFYLNFFWCFFISQSIDAQIRCLNVGGLSQHTNLFVYDGLNTKVYHPVIRHMYGQNLQSNFYGDSIGRIWFTTYEALNYYDPRTDDLDYMFMISSSGDTIKENYCTFHQEGNNLYLKAGKEIFVLDVSTKRTLLSNRLF